MEVRGQPHAPAALQPGKETPESLEHEGGWTPEPVWAFWSTEKSVAPGGIRISDRSAYLFQHNACELQK